MAAQGHVDALQGIDNAMITSPPSACVKRSPGPVPARASRYRKTSGSDCVHREWRRLRTGSRVSVFQ